MRWKTESNFYRDDWVPTIVSIFLLLWISAVESALAQSASEVRNKIAQLESGFAGHFEEKLKSSGQLYNLFVTSRDGRKKSRATLVDPVKGLGVASADFELPDRAKTILVKTPSGVTFHATVLGKAEADHLILFKFDISKIPGLKSVDTGSALERKAKSGSFAAAYNASGKVEIGVVTSETREANKVFPPHEKKALEAHWKRLGLEVSRKRTGFPAVFETDLNLKGSECGCPVFSSEGKLIGVAISRAGHHATLVIPVSRIQSLFEAKI